MKAISYPLISQKPENNNLRLKTAIEIKVYIRRKKKHSFFADTKLQVDQIRKKNRGISSLR